MLKRFDCVNAAKFAYCHGCYGMLEDDLGEYVRYEDAAALELRIRELEQQLMTEAEKRAAFEADC